MKNGRCGSVPQRPVVGQSHEIPSCYAGGFLLRLLNETNARPRPIAPRLAGSGTTSIVTLSYQNAEPGVLMLIPRRISSITSPAPEPGFRLPLPTSALSIK